MSVDGTRSEPRPALTLGKLPPCSLCGPPREPASPDDDYTQANPSKYADGDVPSTERHHGHDHRKIVRPSVAAVRATTASRIQHARRTHPAESYDPADRSQRCGNKQSCNDCGKRNPPGKQSGAPAAEPVARGVRRQVVHCRLGTTRRGAWLSGALSLNRWTWHRTVGTEHAAIARLGFQLCAAAGAFIEELTRIGRHGLRFRNGAVRTGDGRLKKHRVSSSVRTDTLPWW
jgi:hypothetical protein